MLNRVLASNDFMIMKAWLLKFNHDIDRVLPRIRQLDLPTWYSLRFLIDEMPLLKRIREFFFSVHPPCTDEEFQKMTEISCLMLLNSDEKIDIFNTSSHEDYRDDINRKREEIASFNEKSNEELRNLQKEIGEHREKIMDCYEIDQ